MDGHTLKQCLINLTTAFIDIAAALVTIFTLGFYSPIWAMDYLSWLLKKKYFQ